MNTNKNKIITIPNILSAFRILLIPVIVWLYCGKKEYGAAAGVLVLSGVTDVADGFIARRFNMTSDLGKMLDPVADKLTQGVTLLCLGTRFAAMLALGLVLVAKEVFTGVHSLTVVRRTKQVKSADWHGKVVTCLLYLTMAVHILWPAVPHGVTVCMAGVCLAMMAVSFVLYFRRNLAQVREDGAARCEGAECDA